MIQSSHYLLDSHGAILAKLADGEWAVKWTSPHDFVGETFHAKMVPGKRKLLTHFWSVSASHKVAINTPQALYVAPKSSPDFIYVVQAVHPQKGLLKSTSFNYWMHCQQKVQEKDLILASSVRVGFMVPAPKNRGVAIQLHGELYVRDFVPVDDVLRKKLVAIAIGKALTKAKEVGLALILFGGDNGDNLPGSQNLNSVDPYLQDASALDGFHYEPPSQLNFAQWSSPSTTVIGAVGGPGGSAVIYGDGHVKWQNGP